MGLRTIDILAGQSTCQQVIPSSTPRGAVTVYDSALLHRGEANTAKRSRVILNLNIASAESAINEENYQGYFKGKAAQDNIVSHLRWLRDSFDSSFYQELVKGTASARNWHDTHIG